MEKRNGKNCRRTFSINLRDFFPEMLHEVVQFILKVVGVFPPARRYKITSLITFCLRHAELVVVVHAT